MPMLRVCGGISVRLALAYTTVESISIEPLVGVSRPAMQRSVLVLPQPDGPSSV